VKKIVLDDKLHEKLVDQMHPLEIVDAAGNVLGRYVPDLSGYEGLEDDITEEELQRREKETGGRTLAEIMEDLRKRA
jgi:hypothetical protein